MENGVGGGGLVDKRLRAWGGDGALDVEARALGAVVAEVHHDARGKLALDVEIPELDVAEAVVGINGEIVGDRSGGGRETILQSQNVARRADVGQGDRKGRLEGEILNDGGVLGQIVVQAIASADDGLFQGPPSQPDAGSKIVAVRSD